MKNHKTFTSIDDNADHLPQVPYLGQGSFPSLNDLSAANLSAKPEPLNGLQAGDVALLFSDSALSQSNFLMQLAVSLAAGEPFPSLSSAPSAPRRVPLRGTPEVSASQPGPHPSSSSPSWRRSTALPRVAVRARVGEATARCARLPRRILRRDVPSAPTPHSECP